MTTHAPMARVPFAPLDNPRLQHLASAKNRQNGILSQKPALSGKPSCTSAKTSPKRPLEMPTFDDDFDSENVDPTQLLSPSKNKKSKSDAAPFAFSLAPTPSTSTSMPPPPFIPSKMSTPIRANMSTPRTPMTAPAGRSPKRKIAAISKTRRTSAPFTRIDPPFATRGASLPFSLDAALSGTLNKPASVGSTIQESMPKSWFFEIYEDTPEEEAANLMEHSTLTLDLSSDDEEGKSGRHNRGKENIAPEGYEAGVAPRAMAEGAAPRHVQRSEIVRRKLDKDMMDDGERSPLSDLETDPFFPKGLDRDSHVVVDLPTPEKPIVAVEKAAATPTKITLDTLHATPVKASSSSPLALPAVNATSEITFWEDSTAPVTEHAMMSANDAKTMKAVEVYDENTAPSGDV